MACVDKLLEHRRALRKLLLGWFRPAILEAEAARVEMATVLRQHWTKDPIHLYELIFEQWDPPAEQNAGQAQAESHNFVVFIDPEMDVDWIHSSSLTPASAGAVSFAESIGARRCKHLPQEQVLEFKRLIGQAIVDGIRGDSDLSHRLVAQATNFLKDRTTEQSRRWTLQAAHFLAAFFVLLLWLQSNWIVPVEFLLAMAGGVTGAYLSLVQKAGKGAWDSASGFSTHLLEVFSKLVAAAFFGLVAYTISQSTYAPTSLKTMATDSYSIFVLGFMVGWLERVIPRLVSSYAETLEIKGETPNES